MIVTEMFYDGLKYLWSLRPVIVGFLGQYCWSSIYRWLGLKDLDYLHGWPKWGHYEPSTWRREGCSGSGVREGVDMKPKPNQAMKASWRQTSVWTLIHFMTNLS
jgi:hypothetical protein